MARECTVDQLARERMQLLQAQNIRVEELDELAQGVFAKFPAKVRPDVESDEVDAKGVHQ
jgi:hypothetical protein